MAIFNFFKKSDPIRQFSSDADKYTTQEIWEWMNECYASNDVIPDKRDDFYVKSLIDKMSMESDIEILNDSENDYVRSLQLAIRRNGHDYVSIAYQKFNPYVVYITTSPYGFAGDGISFMAYCNKFQKSFPMISIGIVTENRQVTLPNGNMGSMEIEEYTLRTLIPLLGNDMDCDNLLTATRCLPIYGYDLRDGYHQKDIQPYPSKATGLNIQLEKLVKIHNFKKAKNLYPSIIALFGGAAFVKFTTEIPARISNPYLQYLNWCSNGTNLFIPNSSNLIENYRLDLDSETNTMRRSSPHQLVCYSDYPTLFTMEFNEVIKLDNDNKKIALLKFIGKYSSSDINLNPIQYALWKATLTPYSDDENLYLSTISMTMCLPNEVNSKYIAYQMAWFMESIKQKLDVFKPES